MADKKLTNQNKAALLLDWFNSTTNRGDIFYYRVSEVAAVEIRQAAFDRGMIINIIPIDDFIGSITFGRILT